MPRTKRRIDRVADWSVLLFPLVGSLALGSPGGLEVFVMFSGISCLLHLWFHAEDRWRLERQRKEARLRRPAWRNG